MFTLKSKIRKIIHTGNEDKIVGLFRIILEEMVNEYSEANYPTIEGYMHTFITLARQEIKNKI